MSTHTHTTGERNSDTNERFAAGDMVGRYRLIALLASGGMGHVWAARPDGGGFARTVALKLVRSEMSQDENYARMFIDEATVASSIHHPNVCETFELGRHGDTLFMAMEWVSGDSLAGLLRQGDTLVGLEPTIAARVIADACAGLHAAHESVGPDGALLGVVHRDISPPNILVSLQGQAKVSDFGIAKARHQLHERTRTGELKGKFAYIPPEQLTGEVVDRRADVYAMGCVLYVATLGSRPFGNGAEAMGKILRNEYRTPRQVRSDYPPGLEAVIVRALSGKPAARYQSAEEMQVALEEWLLSGGKVVSTTEVAKCVQARLNPETRARNAALMTQNRVLPDQVLTRLGNERDNETPTAGSGVVTVPAEIRQRADEDDSEIEPISEDSVTELTTEPARQRGAEWAAALRLSGEKRLQKPRASDATELFPVTVQTAQVKPRSRIQTQPSMRVRSTPAPDFGYKHRGLVLLIAAAALMLLVVLAWYAPP